MKQGSHQIDMLNGKLLQKLLVFAIPLAISSILQQLFNSVDVAVVGQFASSQDQAAVGCNGPIINLIINLFVGLSVGANVVIANYIGQNKNNKIKSAVHTTMLVAIICGVILLIIELVVAKPVLTLMNTPEDVIKPAITYLRIYAFGMPFFMVYNFGSAILRCIGDTKRPLYCLIISGVLNVGLNLFLVIECNMEVAGVAIATVVSNVASAIMIVWLLCHEKDPIKLSLSELKISRSELNKIMQIGMPAGLQGMVFSIANVCIQASLNGFGSAAVAGSAVTLNFEYISYFVISAFNQAVVTFTSQNYGAQKYSRCNRIFILCMVCSCIITAMMSASFVLGRVFFVGLFTSNPQVAAYAMTRMLIVLTVNFIASSYEIGGAALRGIGYSMTPAVLTVFGTCAFRLVWIYTVCRRFTSFETLLCVYPISWVITGTAVLIAYFFIRKKAYAENTFEEKESQSL